MGHDQRRAAFRSTCDSDRLLEKTENLVVVNVVEVVQYIGKCTYGHGHLGTLCPLQLMMVIYRRRPQYVN